PAGHVHAVQPPPGAGARAGLPRGRLARLRRRGRRRLGGHVPRPGEVARDGRRARGSGGVTPAAAHVCATCGAHYPGDAPPPDTCRICGGERQYVPTGGQRWLSLASLAEDHVNRIEEVEPDLHGVGVEPPVGIGQRALLVRTPEGNVLWDCVPVLTEA